jgi:GTP-binding protein HflX
MPAKKKTRTIAITAGTIIQFLIGVGKAGACRFRTDWRSAISKIYGYTTGLKKNIIHRLEVIYRRKIPPAELITHELARHLCAVSGEIRRQVGLIVDRRGRIEKVVVGTHQRIELPELDRARMGQKLSGKRFLHTHVGHAGLTQDDLTDLSQLRLDCIAAIELDGRGLPGQTHVAHLVPPNPEGRNWEIETYANPYEVPAEMDQMIAALEDEFARFEGAKSTSDKRERAILVGVYTREDIDPEGSMNELKELARTDGLQVVDSVFQYRTAIDPKHIVGKGKLEELIIRSKQYGAGVIVFDRDLTPGQNRNVSEATDQKIIDRTQLILDIFAQHARSRAGKIQVELAQLKYLLPRLAGKGTSMSRLMGGIGGRGPGETKLEMDRRLARTRIRHLEKEIAGLSRARTQQRALRRKEALPIISIVGYTNAGKSTLINALTDSDVKVEDQLFVTLDPTTRRLRFPREREIIITDTVGFIRNLPPDLMNAFRSTLEEMEDADLLLLVADQSDPCHEDHIRAVRKILEEIGLAEIPQLLVRNKIDRLTPDALETARRTEDEGVLISALRGDGMLELVTAIRALLKEKLRLEIEDGGGPVPPWADRKP